MGSLLLDRPCSGGSWYMRGGTAAALQTSTAAFSKGIRFSIK